MHYLEATPVADGFEVPEFTVRALAGKRTCPRQTLDATQISWTIDGALAGNGARAFIDDASYRRQNDVPQPIDVVASYALAEERAASTPLRLVPCFDREGDDTSRAIPSCPSEIDNFWYNPWEVDRVLEASDLIEVIERPELSDLIEAVERKLDEWRDINDVCLSCPFPSAGRLGLSEMEFAVLGELEALLERDLREARAVLPELLAFADARLDRTARALVATAAAVALGHGELFTTAPAETTSVHALLSSAEIDVTPELVAVSALNGYLHAYAQSTHSSSPTAVAASGAAAWHAILEQVR